jgi:hypothetical protein
MRCINSVPAIVIAAFLNALKSEHRSDALLHAPMVLLNQVVIGHNFGWRHRRVGETRYFDERSFVPAGSKPSAFSSRTAR